MSQVQNGFLQAFGAALFVALAGGVGYWLAQAAKPNQPAQPAARGCGCGG